MENIKPNITLIIASISSFIILLMIIYMVSPMEASFMRLFIVLEFCFDFYFATRFFYRLKNYKTYEKCFSAISFLGCFLFSIFNLFSVFGFFSMDKIFLREDFFATLLTKNYHILFLIYITRIVYLFYIFAKGKMTLFSEALLMRFAPFYSAILGVLFLFLYLVFNLTIGSKYIPTYESLQSEVLYEATSRFFANYDDVVEDIDYRNFSENYNLIIFYNDNELKYKSPNYENFNKMHLLFELNVIEGNGFFFITSGKFFLIKFYLFVLLYILALVITLTPIIIFTKKYLKIKLDVYIDSMIKNFEDDNYNKTVDIHSMEKTTLRKLIEMFNSKYLSLKYRDKYMKIDIR